MYRSEKFPPPPLAVIEAFVASHAYAKILAAPLDRGPEATLIPYTLTGNLALEGDAVVEAHLVDGDPTLEALAANPRASVLVDELLSFIPHTVFDPMDGNRAMILFRSLLLSGRAEISDRPEEIGEGLERLIRRLEPGAPFDPVTVERYGSRVTRLRHVRIAIDHIDAKWKLAQDQPPEVRDQILAYLRARDLPIDRVTRPILLEYWSILGLDRSPA
ncbi:MAG: FMN-binding negative transcriptional regulator [Firmicutes bacterium]|nr:FMN-binding negative transcriptional regulator [Bacillota bacterium]